MPFFTIYSRYSFNVVHSISYLMLPCLFKASAFIESFIGPIDDPSPMISSVTPCFISLMALPSSIKEVVAHESMLIKPGATARPLASISFLAITESN